ncbi:IclR family transcriptional regulator domain-containing protein [Acidocella sp.]|uniref:IclR family transcriptional regulator domain-containing protein n=1 Tax=Acidocella sp. TaxID=50710 RepID=UPI003CFDA815
MQGQEVKEKSAEDPRFMTSLARGLEVLAAFEAQPGMTVTQAAKATGLSRSAAGRCLFTLERLGYVTAEGASYMLCPAVMPLARAFLAGHPLARAGQAVVDALRDRLGESSSLAMFDTRSAYNRVVYVCRAETARIISVPLFVGTTLPSYCASNGRALLAWLPPGELARFLAQAPFSARTPKTLIDETALRAELETVRAQGWAMTDGELEAGLRSIAVPVRGADGQVAAAINLATQSAHRSQDWLLQTALPELQAAAAHLARVAFG